MKKGKRVRKLKRYLVHWRSTVLMVAFFLIYTFLLNHAYLIQVDQGGTFAAKAEAQYRSSGFLQARRGSIYLQDKNSSLLQGAVTKEMPFLYGVPDEIEDAEMVAFTLSETFDDIDFEELYDRLALEDDEFEEVLPRLTEEQVALVSDLDLPGVYVGYERERYYPNGGVASHVLGFVAPNADDSEVRGRYGIELSFNDMLMGRDGYVGDNNTIQPPINGDDLILTLDYNIQSRAEDLLSDMVEEHDAKGGDIIVMDPQTGAIRAMAGYPEFDPNNYSEYEVGVFLNDAIESVYEPGSIFKVITMASALDADAITPEETYYDKGYLKLNGYTIRNWDLKAHGRLSMTNVIEQSINTGAVYAQQQLGKEAFREYMHDFGFEEDTGVQLPGEQTGSLRTLNEKWDINFATASFGQGVSVTPLALLRAMAAIANEGVMMKPYLIDRIENDGDVVDRFKPRIVRRVVGKGAAKEATEMMVSAVRKNVLADIPSYEVAGKTGTAQVPDFVNGGYRDDVVNNTYVGYAPASDPAFIILVKLDEPYGAPLAGQTVVPVFKSLAEFVLNYYEIPPDSF